jgi:hypothetical protein
MLRWVALLTMAFSLHAGALVALGESPANRSPAPALTVTSDFPNGSGEVQAIDQQVRVIRLFPARRPDRGWTLWWYVKVSGIKPGETLTLDVGGGGWATPDRAVFSTDGKTWQPTPPGQRSGQRIAYQQKMETAEAWFAWGPPFTPADAAELIRWAAEKCPQAKAVELCQSLERRAVPALRIEPTDAPTQPRGIIVLARQHAWEVGGSWVGRGFVEWLVSDDPRAAVLRKKSRVLVVPIVDIDNVAVGAGGKEQQPQDHNRDWTDRPHFPAVAALQNEIKKLDAAGQLDLFIDLHAPAPSDLKPFFFVSPRMILSDVGTASIERFLQCGRLEMTGPITFDGQSRESGPDYDARWLQISKNWVTQHARPQAVAITLEIPWNTPQSTADNYRRLGVELGQAIERYFRTPKPAHGEIRQHAE